ncbi:MAG: 3-oxo-tetronate kinase [Burkholderiaceae bacterium]
MLLGCIADDFTGASDLANMLTVAGMKTVQIIGVPQDGATAEPIAADAVVVALKSRSVAVGEAVEQSLAALAWLRAAGARQYLFKYCSTFDSTPEGNIGPVAEALMAVLDTDFTIACPAFPANRRTVFQGHLFVGDRLLSESGMEHHPVTPMTDPDLVRWLQRQCRGKVGLVDNATVDAGPEAIDARFTELAGLGVKVAICDATSDRHLRALGKAAERLALITGGSGIALGLPDNFRASGALQAADANVAAAGGRAIVLSGSCSTATRGQIDSYRSQAPARLVTAEEVVEQGLGADTVARWALEQPAEPAPLVYTSADPAAVEAAQKRFGGQRVSMAIERFTAEVARALAEHGFRRFVVAGGETSGAVVQALGARRFAIGSEIDPGVPVLRALDAPYAMALKSGNFGARDFFTKALAQTR